MNRKVRAESIVVLLSILVSTLCGCSRPAGTPQTGALPRIDKTELLRLAKHGDLWNGEIEAQTTLTGNDAEVAAQLWRAQSFSAESPICHNPGYAIKFYDHEVLLVYATLCWECDNIEFLTPQIGKYVGFDAQGIKGKELLKFLEDKLGRDNAMASSRRTLRAPEPREQPSYDAVGLLGMHGYQRAAR